MENVSYEGVAEGRQDIAIQDGGHKSTTQKMMKLSFTLQHQKEVVYQLHRNKGMAKSITTFFEKSEKMKIHTHIPT